jgi:hypothetical protein
VWAVSLIGIFNSLIGEHDELFDSVNCDRKGVFGSVTG